MCLMLLKVSGMSRCVLLLVIVDIYIFMFWSRTLDITTIPGISLRMGAMIIAEIGDFNNFDSPDKILAFSGLYPSTYQSGQINNCYAHMEKRGSRYLRYALFNATKYVCDWNPLFADYLAKKRSEGKHYNVAISHAAKKLVRLIFALQKSGQPYMAKV